MKRNLSLFFICLSVVVCSSCGTKSAAISNPASDAEKRLQGSNRFERDGWVYVHIEGAPDRLGYQHGYLIAARYEDRGVDDV